MIGRATWLGDLLAQLGFNNLAAGMTGRQQVPGYFELSDEVLATLRPELVLLVTHGSPRAVEESFRRRAAAGGAWTGLGDNLRVLDPDLFATNPGLRLPEAARRLAELGAELPAR
jgi:ABC-type hemin transport system substrate-binding protein